MCNYKSKNSQQATWCNIWCAKDRASDESTPVEEIAFLLEFMNSLKSVAWSSQRTASCEGKKKSWISELMPGSGGEFTLAKSTILPTLHPPHGNWWNMGSKESKSSVWFSKQLDGMMIIIIIIMCKTIIILNIFEWRLQNNSTVSVENWIHLNPVVKILSIKSLLSYILNCFSKINR